MSVSHADAKPEPTEMPVTLMTCGVTQRTQSAATLKKRKHAKCDGSRKKVREPTAVANATPASSVFPRWPQKIMLTNPIRKVINWAMYWFKTKKSATLSSFLMSHLHCDLSDCS